MKKIISLIIALTMLLSLGTATVLNTSAAWAGGVATGFAGGSGTEADPYQIASGIELALIAKMVNEDADSCEGKYFKLIADIDLGGVAWEPIGNYANKTEIFKGHFDGNGHTVSGLKVEASGSHAGLFGRVMGSTIKNLTVKGELVTSLAESGSTYVGSVAAYGIDSVKIINCHSEVELVKGTTVGGIIGRAQNSAADLAWNEIVGCTFSGNVEGGSTNKDVFAAGIIGACGATNVKYCGNFGNVSNPEGSTNLCLAGGIVGVQGASNITAHINNCFNTGDISAFSNCNATYAGGIVGRSAHVADYIQMADVKNCFSTSKNVIVKDATGAAIDGKFGSLIGHIRNLATVANCYTAVPFTEMPEVGTDAMTSVEANSITVLALEQMKGADAVATMKLGSAWVAGSDLPTVDIEKALTATDDVPADTTPAETTPAETTPAETTPAETTPADTTTVSDEGGTTPGAPVETTPVEDETTPAPVDDDEQGGGSKTILWVLIAVVAVGAAGAIVFVVISEKKKTK